MKIVRIVVRDDKGNLHEWAGVGEAQVVATATEVDGLAPSQWPKLKFVSAHLVVKP